MREYSDIVIIGAGASGLLCGGLLVHEGFSVTIIEKNSRVGKKLSATGNGRCNFTNRKMDVSCYYGDENWIQSVLAQVGVKRVLRQFESLGIYAREKDGYVYPYTNQALTVVEALQRFARGNQIEILLDCKARSLKKEENGYRVGTHEGEISCQYVIMASGGKAGGELGGSGSGYKLAGSLGHHIHTIYPGLTGLVSPGDFWKQVAGTRIQGRFSLSVDHRIIEGEVGEIQIVKDGVSGIPVFQLCRMAALALAEGRYVEGVIDFVPPMEEKELQEWLIHYGMEGLVPKKWLGVLRKNQEPEKCLKAFRFPIIDTFGIDRAQVSAGGVDTGEVDSKTMESKLAPGVFFTGEILDVDGKCGGYNLHFAWACANIAADAIKKKKEEKA
ncbi:MAG: aminoacetone oxidase family FAD-binding enzyme [Lachnospiraceae bacterium]|nr:aminoacetone oxidase family FAD-binding enzyme [Lachnospiraceae bacterium]